LAKKRSGIVQLNLNSVRHRDEEMQSRDDIDLEDQSATDQSAVLFLKHKIDKIWKSLEQINETLYHEDTVTISRHKPVFDKEKKKLQMLSSIMEKQLNTGNYVQLKKSFHAKEYSDYLLNTYTISLTWNTYALEINHLIKVIQKVEEIEISLLLLEKQAFKKAEDLKHGSPRSKKGLRLFLYFVLLCLTTLICFEMYRYDTTSRCSHCKTSQQSQGETSKHSSAES